MQTQQIIHGIDQEIAVLTQARNLLLRNTNHSQPRKPRVLSVEARKRIADAQKRRWAKVKAAAKKK
jgi:hypothetical protein